MPEGGGVPPLLPRVARWLRSLSEPDPARVVNRLGALAQRRARREGAVLAIRTPTKEDRIRPRRLVDDHLAEEVVMGGVVKRSRPAADVQAHVDKAPRRSWVHRLGLRRRAKS
jgi:hypothetical protein